MDYLEKYEKYLRDEIEGARRYAKWGLELKADQPEFAKKMKDMAMQELNHYQNLDMLAQKMTPDNDEATKSVAHMLRRMHEEEIAEIRYYISMI